MNRQSQWLFEAPASLEIDPYTHPEYYSLPEWQAEWELQESDPYGLGEEEWERSPSSSPRGKAIRETISGFSRYSNAIPTQERAKIAGIAQIIVQSHRSGQPIRTIRLVGHADRDIQRGASFEKKISGDRALEVKKQLINSIRNPAIASQISFQIQALGATQLVVPNPKIENDRGRNRRVEILVNTSPLPPDPVPASSCGNLQIWINAFIPRDVPGYTFTIPTGPHAGKTAIPCPLVATPANPNCFRLGYLTDQRTFDDKPTASVRMRSIAEIQLVSPKLIRTNHQTSGTTEINKNTGAITCANRADMKRCKFENFSSSPLRLRKGRFLDRFPSGDFIINLSVKAAASDPCVNLAADIDYEGNIEIICLPSRGTVEVRFNGKLDSFPAFEMYASLNGTTKTLFRLPPPPGNTVVNLLGRATTPISGKVVFNCSLINKGIPTSTTTNLRARPLVGIR